MSSRSNQGALCAGVFIAIVALVPTAGAGAGQALLALSPGPAAGDFDVDAYLLDPEGWAAQAADHPHGWAVAYRASAPPPGWERPFIMRGGGRAAGDGALHPRFDYALGEMLPTRAAALLALRNAPNPEACHPGQPNPHPLYRDGWLFAHDGQLAIEPVVTGIWRAEWGPPWESFRDLYPRDFNGNADSTRGNAGEIYFLTLLYDLHQAGGDLPTAVRRTLSRISSLPGAETWQLNAILQSADCTCAIRFAAASEEDYPLYWGLTTNAEYCLLDSLPQAGSWEEIPNHSLAVFPAGGPVEISPIEFSAAPETPALETLSLRILGAPSVGQVRLALEVPDGSLGLLELWDIEGRLLSRIPVPAGAMGLTWQPPAELGSGLILARLRAGAQKRSARVLLLP